MPVSFDPKVALTSFAETIKMGLPLSDLDVSSIPIDPRARLFKEGYIEKRLNLYYAMSKAEKLFR